MIVEKVCKFLKDAKTYYLATVDGDKPKVRPFGTAHIIYSDRQEKSGVGADKEKSECRDMCNER